MSSLCSVCGGVSFGRLAVLVAVLRAVGVGALGAGAAEVTPAWPLPEVAPESAGVSSERLGRLHAGLAQRVDEGKYSGYILLLARDGKIVDWRAHGWRDLEGRVPLERTDIVRLHSMTKLVTSVAALMLVEDGRMRLEDPVEKFLPALKDRKVCVGGTPDALQLVDADRPITVRDLMRHTSGYGYAEDWSVEPPLLDLYRRVQPSGGADLEDLVARAATLPLHDQPGTRFRYGISTDLLGAVIEKASGQNLADFFQSRIFGPLGMRDSGFWVPDAKRARVAVTYERGPDGKLVRRADYNRFDVGPGHGLLEGGGGLFSTAGDYVRFAQMLLNGGHLGGVRLLGRKTVELMTANHLVGLADPHPFGAKSQGFGLGVRVITDLGQSFTPGSAGCFGWDGAATTNVQIDPHERTVALFLMQHATFNEDDIFSVFTAGYCAALVD